MNHCRQLQNLLGMVIQSFHLSNVSGIRPDFQKMVDVMLASLIEINHLFDSV